MSTNFQPYVGPRPFEQQHESVFFGREREVNDIISLIVSHPATLVYSQSGAGKTSLLNAKLIPLLERKGFQVLPRPRMRDPLPVDVTPTNVYAFNTLVGWGCRTDSQQCAQMSLADYLKGLKHNVSEEEGENSWPLPRIAIWDQFEEFFTFHQERWQNRQGFFEQVNEALNADPLLRVVFLMREDYIAELDPFVSILPEKLKTRFRLERLREQSALLAVKEPLRDTNLYFEEGVAEQLVRNLLEIPVKTPTGMHKVLGEFVEPVQLQVVCQNLWEPLKDGANERRGITQENLKKYGDVNKALSAFYEKTLEKVLQEETVKKTGLKEGALRRWFERVLITPAGTRGTVYRGAEETSGIPNVAVDELDRQHIIRAELRGGERWYELSHDRLIQPIKESNKQWLLKHSSAESKRQNLEDKALAWMGSKKDSTLLLNEVEVADAEHWLDSAEAADVGYSDAVSALVQASRIAVDKATYERESEHQRALIQEQTQRAEDKAKFSRRLMWALGVLVLLLLSTISAGGLALSSAAEARRNAEEATKQRKLADSNAEAAIEQSEIANEEKQKAIAAADDATKARASADEERVKAVKLKEIAEKKSKEADQQRKAALEARRQTEIALAKAKEAGRLEREAKELVLKQVEELKQERAGYQARATELEQTIKGASDEAQKYKDQIGSLQATVAELEKRLGGSGTVKDADAYYREGLDLEVKGDTQAAINRYNRAIELYQENGNKSGQANARTKLGGLYFNLPKRDYVNALANYESALQLTKDVNDRTGEADLLKRIGAVYLSQYDYTGSQESANAALNHLNQALAIYRGRDDYNGMADTFDKIGDAHRALGNFDSAVNSYREAESIYDESQNEAAEGQMLFNIGYAYQQKGDSLKASKNIEAANVSYKASLEYYNQSWAKRIQLGDTAGRIATLNNMAEVYRSLGQPEKAAEYFRRARQLQQQPTR